MGLMPLFPELAVLLALGWASAWALSSKERAGDGGGRTSSSFGGARAGERWARALVLVAIGGLVLLEGVVPTLFFDRIAGAVSDEVRQVNPPGPDRLARSSRAILGPWVALRP
jgi:hypothetical protein